MFGTKILETRKSKYNGIVKVVKSLGYGTYLQAGGLTQSGGIVETIWRSTLKQINPCLRRQDLSNQPINSCLILGLGGGSVAKLIRKNWPEAKITGVDIDPIMIKLGKKYLKLDDYKVKIIVTDASNFSNSSNLSNQKFDLVVVDLYNGDNFPEKFETEEFMKLVRCHLTSFGVIVFNRLYYGDKRPQAVKFGNKLQKMFKKVDWYYPEANLMFICSA